MFRAAFSAYTSMATSFLVCLIYASYPYSGKSRIVCQVHLVLLSQGCWCLDVPHSKHNKSNSRQFVEQGCKDFLGIVSKQAYKVEITGISSCKTLRVVVSFVMSEFSITAIRLDTLSLGWIMAHAGDGELRTEINADHSDLHRMVLSLC